ncbi:MAG: hypothetical protein ACXVJT_10285, partial [Thermoanaerobaculia bacterium]
AATRMAENLAQSDYRTWFLNTLHPELVTPLVLALAHHDCHVTGELLVVAGGRIARTIVGESHGIVDRDLTAEAALAHLHAVLADRDWTIPADTAASGALAARVLGHDIDVTMTMTATTSVPPRKEIEDDNVHP